MKKVFLAVSLMACAGFSAFAQTQSQKSAPTKAEEEILVLNRSWAEAISKNDPKTLEQLFSDDVIVTAGNGTIRTKAEEIKDAAPGTKDPDFVWIKPFTTENERVRVYNEAAVVTGTAKWAFSYKGREANHERRYTHTYVKQQGEWKIVAQHISTNLYKP